MFALYSLKLYNLVIKVLTFKGRKVEANNLVDFIIEYLMYDEEIISELKTANLYELNFLHISVGQYIRNKFLWGNAENIKILSQHFGTDCLRQHIPLHNRRVVKKNK